MAKWFCVIAGKQIGPIESAELKQLADSGTLDLHDKVRRDDMVQWLNAKQVAGLFTEQPLRIDALTCVPARRADPESISADSEKHSSCIPQPSSVPTRAGTKTSRTLNKVIVVLAMASCGAVGFFLAMIGGMSGNARVPTNANIKSELTRTTKKEAIKEQTGIASALAAEANKNLITAGEQLKPIVFEKGVSPDGHTDTVSFVAFSDDSRKVLTGSHDETAILWDAPSGKKLRTFRSDLFGFALSRDGRQVLTTDSIGDRSNRRYIASLWDAVSGSQLRVFDGHSDYLYSVAFSPDGQYLLTGSSDHSTILWDALTGERIRSFADTVAVRSVAFSVDGRYVLTCVLGAAELWSRTSGEVLQQYYDADTTCAALSPAGQHVLTGAGRKAILWDMHGNKLRTFESNADVRSIAFSPDGRQILTGWSDGTAILWDSFSDRKLRTFIQPDRSPPVLVAPTDAPIWLKSDGMIRSVAFSANARYILTGSLDNTAIIWDATTGEKIRVFGVGNRGK
jgi:WD40 repeat protein